MAIQTLIKLDGKEYTSSVLTPFKIKRSKLWGEGSGRLLNGDMDSVLVGIFPTISPTFFPKTEEEMSELLVTLDQANVEVDYYDPKTRTLLKLGTYTSDYEITIINLTPFYSEVQCNFIALRKEQ